MVRVSKVVADHDDLLTQSRYWLDEGVASGFRINKALAGLGYVVKNQMDLDFT